MRFIVKGMSVTYIVSRKLTISKYLTLKESVSIGPMFVVARRLCKYERIAPAQPTVTGFSMSTELEMCKSLPS